MDRELPAIIIALKEQLTAVPLSTSNKNKPMVLYMDASVAACLTQPYQEKESLIAGASKGIPVYFLSHRLSPTQQRWPVIKKEAYVIVYA